MKLFWWWITKQKLKDTKTSFVCEIILYNEWMLGEKKSWRNLIPHFAITDIGYFSTNGDGKYFYAPLNNIAAWRYNKDFPTRFLLISL